MQTAPSTRRSLALGGDVLGSDVLGSDVLGSDVLGSDAGGTKSAAVIGTADGAVLARAPAWTPQASWQEEAALQIRLVYKVCQDYRMRPEEAAALGVPCGGPLDSKTGILYAPPNPPPWDAVPLRSLLEAELRLPVAVENDANAAASAEHRWGAGRGCTNMAF